MRRAPRRRGILVALEGVDGSGKSTLGRRLATALRRRGFTVARYHEPFDRTLGEVAQSAGIRDAWTSAVYFTVDRHLARPTLEEALRRSDVVLADRSFYSTLAYQGSSLPPCDARRLEAIEVAAAVRPDLVVLLDLPTSEALRRLVGRGGRRGPFERRTTLARVGAAYRRYARRDRWTVVDARRPADLLLAEVREAVERAAHPPRPKGKTLSARRPPRAAR